MNDDWFDAVWMLVWKDKRTCRIDRHRIQHFLIAAAIPLLTGRHSYSWLAWGLIGSVILGIGWELATPVLAPILGWSHPYGDLVDLIVWILGACLGAILALGFRAKRGRE